MSHEATHWAFRQRGLRPHCFAVLVRLADCHTPDKGCFPSQAYLVEATGMSARTLNRVLVELEGLGLLERVERWCKRTGARQSTLYRLRLDVVLTPCQRDGGPSVRGDRPPCQRDRGPSVTGDRPPCQGVSDPPVRMADNPVRESVREPSRARPAVEKPASGQVSDQPTGALGEHTSAAGIDQGSHQPTGALEHTSAAGIKDGSAADLRPIGDLLSDLNDLERRSRPKATPPRVPVAWRNAMKHDGRDDGPA